MIKFRRIARPARERASADESARAAALRHLARRDFGSTELRERLRAQGYGEEAAAQVLSELTGEGLLDDTRFAASYVTVHAGRGQGPVRIATMLRGLGLADEVISAALASGPDWQALALRVRRGKFGAKPPASWPEKARQARFLQYRGFSSDDIRAATDADVEQD
jgi:regulatory protein